jgi:hypothetical protein
MALILENARKLADFMVSFGIYSFADLNIKPRPAYNHLGALLTDIVLQPGLNYNSVVRPRVARVLYEFSYASTTPLLMSITKVYGAEYFLNWKNSIKTGRFLKVLSFCRSHYIYDERDFCKFLLIEKNRNQFLEINGVGPKTTDYALKLMGAESVAVDRHILNFVKQSGITVNDYGTVKKIVEYAADLLCISRTKVDTFVWHTMSRKNSKQLSCEY